MEILLGVAKEFGLAVTLVVYLIWDRRQIEARIAREGELRDEEAANREANLGQRLREVEDFQRNTLIEVIKENTVALRAVLATIKETTHG